LKGAYDLGKLFGTDGVRGVANESLGAQLAYGLGRAGAHVLAGRTKHSPSIIVGKDTRISGDMLEAALIAGICSTGAHALSIGVVPTPAVAALIRIYKADAGVMISASHNSFEYNGIKFFDSRGYKLPDSLEDEVESYIENNFSGIPSPTGEHMGRCSKCYTAADDYISFLKGITGKIDLNGIKIAVDCANGSCSGIAPKLLKELGAIINPISCNPDGLNINFKCGSTNLENLGKHTVLSSSDLGIAFDGDADRMLAVDENGKHIDGDIIMSIIGVDMKNKNTLKKNTIVTTLMSNIGFDVMAAREGINLVKTKVGDRYVLEEMIANGYVLGGEQSGHIIFSSDNTTGDGLLTALRLLEVIVTSGKKLSALSEIMDVFPEVLVNATVKPQNRECYLQDNDIAEFCRNIEDEFRGEGRVLIRPSGTEPLIRIKIEGKDKNHILVRAQELAKLIERKLG
jgi:phosphoglucosamine mutase